MTEPARDDTDDELIETSLVLRSIGYPGGAGAHHLMNSGLGCHTERSDLDGHESGQDHLGIYHRNGNEYLRHDR